MRVIKPIVTRAMLLTLAATLAATLTACNAPEEALQMEVNVIDTTTGNATDNPMETDPWLWLEEVEGERAVAWAAEQNAKSIPRLQGDPRFTEIEAEILAIMTSDDRIPFGNLVDGMVYNFWQDAQHVRGILRRSSLESYQSADIQWETVLDVDALAIAENANWVYKATSCLPADQNRCLLQLSDGGKDAVSIREYDLLTQSFIEGGFALAEAKTSVAWVDSDTLLVATDVGAGSMTSSGYARTVRLWPRGTALADAPQIFEGNEADVSAGVRTISKAVSGALAGISEKESYSFVRRAPDFFTEEYWLLGNEGDLARLPLPIDANFQGLLGDQAIVLLRSDWTVSGDELSASGESGSSNASTTNKTYTAGSLISLDLMQSVSSGTASNVRTLIDPAASDEIDAINSVAISSESIYISALKDVNGILLQARPADQDWTLARVDLPDNGAVQIVSADNYSDSVMLTYQSFLIPSTLYLIEGEQEPKQVMALKPRFDASAYVAEQRFARSADGTRVPYFVVRSANIPMDGSTPTQMTAYGGFQLSRTPSYMSALDQAWLTRGGSFVLANIRGGGEYGPQWHQSALLENRQRVFDDFIAVAEDLIASGLTSPAHLGIRGGSNGGLLTTAVMVQRPDLFNAVISAVPLIDMLRYHKLLAGASWMAEYGNPDIPEHRAFISQYSPYQRVSPDAKYPEVFLWTNPKDDRVHPGHARKMTARMIEQGHQVIYFEDAEGGHGGSNLNQQARIAAMQVVYLFGRLGG
jgi:prolyl oligopeptidase